ncbi:MAG TPA: ABC transporter substrate-binding protein [Polyangiaceae bacterium]|nr:ABC transporter substrate-binding protein [Polyangiaceae bacterium]
MGEVIDSPALCGAIALSLAGCSLVLDREPVQCETADDCLALGPDFAGTVCGADKLCVEAGECQTNADCTATLGADSICRKVDHTCAPLFSEDCTTVEGDVQHDEAIIIGMMSATTGAGAPVGTAMQNSVRLAYSEFADFALGLPGGEGGTPRPLAVIGCDEYADAERAARHLIDTVGVPVIIGPSESGAVLDVALLVSIPAGVLIMSPSATSPAITGLDDDNLVWRTAPSDAIQAVPLTLLVERFEADVRLDLGLDPAEAIRLAVVSKADAYGTGISEAVLEILEFNGKDPLENGSDFFQRIYAGPAEDPSFDAVAIAAELTSFAPHVVVLLGTEESVSILAALENAWPGALPPPRYVLTGWGKTPQTLELIGSANDELRSRILGAAPGRKNENFDKFVLRYKGAFGDVPSTFGASNAYDAAYVVAYAITASGDAPLVGGGIATGFGMTVGGAQLIDVGPNPINQALGRLRGGEAIDFSGASGPLDFDLTIGEALSDIDVWCVVRNPMGDPIFESSGQYYDGVAQVLVGTIDCP